MPLLLRLFFIRRSKNNRRRSHAGSEGQTVFQKNGEPGCLEPGHLQTRDCSSEIGAPVFKKIPGRLARHGRTHTDARRQDFLAASQERCGTGAFPQRAVHWTWKTSGKRGCQADASGCARGSVRPFKKIQPLVASLQEDCASRSGAADPVQARAITKSDGCWRTRASGRESARALQRPAEDRGGLAAVRPWVARASASWAFCWPVGGVCWRVWPGRGAGTVCEIQRYPAGSGDRAAQACREMREPGNTVAHRLCASGLWAIGKLAD
ncbi:hypothetical protein KDK82_4735 [Delftia sp. K82]|nr:hypothetical protein KDK82_4735 [Delftia sp. K82]